MNKKLPHFFACLSVLGLSASPHAADHWGGEWGDGTPTKTTSLSTSTSSPKKTAPVGDSSPASAAAGPLKKNVSSSYASLSDEPGFLTPCQDAAPGTSTGESFNPYADAILSFRWMNLVNGYPDPAKNYDAKNRQYYDASTGVFPSKQPQNNNLKNQVGTEMKTWQIGADSSREAYKTAYQDWQDKQNRYIRKQRESAANTLQQLDSLAEQLDSLADSILESRSPNSTISTETAKKEQKKGEVLTRARLAANAAKIDFEKKQKMFLALHPIECKTAGDDRQLISLTPEELERRFIWGYVEKPLFTAYKTLPRQRHDPNNIKGFLLIDPVDIQIGIYMLSNMTLRLEHEYSILMDIRTRYKRDFVPQVTGLLSPAKWRNWYYATSANSLKDELKKSHPSPSIARFTEPQTDQEETLRLLRRDALGKKLRSKYLDHIKRYQEVVNSDISGLFFKVYQGLDQVEEVEGQIAPTFNKLSEQRNFPKPLLTPFVNIKTRYQRDPEDNENLFPDVMVVFTPPKKAQMATQYVSPKAMGFHRRHWSSIMSELKTEGRSVLKTQPFKLGSPAEYRALYQQYESLVQDISIYLKTLQTADSYSLPTPFEFFFTDPLPLKQIAPATEIKLEEREITDQDLTHTRLLPGGKSESVLQRYAKVNLANNDLKSPNSTAFGPHLISLNVSHNQLRDLEFALPLTSLRELDVSDQVLHNLPPFGNDGVMPLPNLEKFILAHTGLSQIAPLANFASLRILDLSRNNIVTVTPLKDLKNLEDLNFEQNNITDIGDLESLYKLRHLNVSRNPLTSLKSTVKLEALQVLIANYCRLAGDWSTILPLAKTDSDPCLKALKNLQLKGNDKIIWLPYQTKRAYNGLEVAANNKAFNASFPALQVLEVGSSTKFEATADKAITLSDLERR